MNDQHPKRSRLPLIVMGVALLAGVAAFGTGRYYESRQLQRLNEALARIPVEYGFTVGAVDGSLFGRTLTLKKIAFTLPSEENPVAVSMDEATGEGIGLASLFAPGVVTLADSLAIKNLTLSGKDFTFSAERSALRDVRADVAKIRAGWKEFLEALAEEELAGEKDKEAEQDETRKRKTSWEKSGFNTVSIAGFECSGIAFSGSDGLTVKAGSAAFTGYTGLDLGPVSIKDISLAVAAKGTVAIVEAGLVGIAIPDAEDRARLIELPPDDPMPRKGMLKRDIAVNGLFVRNVVVSAPMPDGVDNRVSVDEVMASLQYGNQHARVEYAVNAMKLEKRLFAVALDLLADTERESLADTFDALEEALSHLPDPIVSSSRVSVELAANDNGGMTMTIHPVMSRVDQFAFMEFSCVANAGWNISADTLTFKKLGFTVEDSGASECIFSLLGREKNMSAAQMRAQALNGFATVGILLQGPLADLHRNTLDFLEKPGAALSVQLDLPEALTIDAISTKLMTAPGTVGLTSSVSREAAPEKRQP